MKWIKATLLMLVFGFSINALALNDDDEMAFKDALQNGDMKKVAHFVKQEPGVVNEKFFGWSPIQMATNSNQIEVVKYLISKGGDVNYVHPNANHSAFHLAAFNGSKEMMKVLAASGANVNEKLKGGVSLIRYFRENNDDDMVKFLTDLGVKDDGCSDEKCF